MKNAKKSTKKNEKFFSQFYTKTTKTTKIAKNAEHRRISSILQHSYLFSKLRITSKIFFPRKSRIFSKKIEVLINEKEANKIRMRRNSTDWKILWKIIEKAKKRKNVFEIEIKKER